MGMGTVLASACGASQVVPSFAKVGRLKRGPSKIVPMLICMRVCVYNLDIA
jgi:hypothetical protein